jgi:hypothetical protein
MTDVAKARYVQLRQENGRYVVVLLDGDRRECGHGFKGAGRRRAEEDLKYWTRERGLEELPETGEVQ